MDINAFGGPRNEECVFTSISEDEPILDLSSSQTAMPLDDKDARVMRQQHFSKPMSTDDESGIEVGVDGYNNGYVSRRNGYQALLQVGNEAWCNYLFCTTSWVTVKID